MAKTYIHEIGDMTSSGAASDEGDKVVTLAPMEYKDSSGNPAGYIDAALASKQDSLTEMTDTEVDDLLAVMTA